MIEVDGLILKPSVMAEHFARFDWSRTPLGPVSGWPEALRTSVQLCLNAPFPMTVGWGPEFLIIYNDGYIPIMGAKHPDGLGRPALEIYGDLADRVSPILRRVYEQGETFGGRNVAFPMVRQDALEEGYFDFWYVPIRDAQGGIGGVLASGSETTTEVVAQRRQDTVTAVAGRFVELSIEERVLPNALEVLLRNREDIARIAVFEVMAAGALTERFASPEAFPAELEAAGVLRGLRDRVAAGIEYGSRVERLDARRFLTTLARPDLTDSTAHLVVVEPAPSVRADDPYQGFLDVLREIITGAIYRVRTERAALAEIRRQLDDRDRLYRMLFEHTSEGIVIAHPNGTIVAANPATCRLLGYREEDLLELGYAGTVVNESGELERALEILAINGRFEGEIRLRARNGQIVLTDTASVLTRDEASGNERIITLLRDAAPRVESQVRMTATARLEALGQLTGGISHDFNNLLNVIINGAEELAESLPAGRPEHESAGLILSASLRAAELTRQLLSFSQQRPNEPRQLRTSEAVTELQRLLARVIGSGVQVRVSQLEDAEILVDPALLSSSLLNLCINARDAMPDGGTLGIRAGRTQLGGDVARRLQLPAGDYAVITVSDTGIGIPKGLVDRVIEPYFTTKPAGQGTGLGLAMVYGFVRQCGGALEIDSTPGEGTTVTLLFPVAAAAPATTDTAATDGQEQAEAGGGGEHVLVVEDNDLLARMLGNTLRRAGYQITHCEHAGAALEVLAGGEGVDVVLTDIQLGDGPTGWELLDRIGSLDPDLPVLTMSGFAPEATATAVRGARMPDLSKPFRPREVLELVASALARRGSG